MSRYVPHDTAFLPPCSGDCQLCRSVGPHDRQVRSFTDALQPPVCCAASLQTCTLDVFSSLSSLQELAIHMEWSGLTKALTKLELAESLTGKRKAMTV